MHQVGPKVNFPVNFSSVATDQAPYVSRKKTSLYSKQILAQQPGGARAFPFGISRQICFFSEVDLSDQCP
jgi:hypothetical protein